MTDSPVSYTHLDVYKRQVTKRNIVGVATAHPEIAKRGVLLRKFGQEVIRVTAGKRVHGTGAVPGGMNKSLTVAERDELLKAVSYTHLDVYKRQAPCRD